MSCSPSANLTERALRGKIREGLVRPIEIDIAGALFLHECDLEHAFGHQFLPRE